MGRGRYSVRFWANNAGKKPVADWILSLPDKDKEYVGYLLKLLSVNGPYSNKKVFKNIHRNLWEIRDLRTGPGFRIYFSFDGDCICLVLAAGKKDTQEHDIMLAMRRSQ